MAAVLSSRVGFARRGDSNVQRDIILIYGPNGAGKTTLAAEHIGKDRPRVLIADAGFQEFPAVYHQTFEDVNNYLARIGAYPLENGRGTNVPFRVAWTPIPQEYPLIFDAAEGLTNCLLLLEEIDRFGDGREGACCTEYDSIIARGRHYNISILGIGQQPIDTPKNLRRQATQIKTFGLSDPGDVAALSKTVGPKIYNLPPPPEQTDPPHPYLHYRRGKGSEIVVPKGIKYDWKQALAHWKAHQNGDLSETPEEENEPESLAAPDEGKGT